MRGAGLLDELDEAELLVSSPDWLLEDVLRDDVLLDEIELVLLESLLAVLVDELEIVDSDDSLDKVLGVEVELLLSLLAVDVLDDESVLNVERLLADDVLELLRLLVELELSSGAPPLDELDRLLAVLVLDDESLLAVDVDDEESVDREEIVDVDDDD